MSQNKEDKTHSQIQTLLNEGKLYESISLIKAALNNKTNPKLLDRLNRLEDTYRYMIHYLVEGYSDSGREDMLSDIKGELHLINDLVLRDSLLPSSEDVYSSTLRFENIRKASLEGRLSEYKNAFARSSLAEAAGGNREMERETENALSSVFSYVWTMFGANANDYRTLTEYVISDQSPFSFKAQIISALFLGNMKYFDPDALSALIDIYEADLSDKISARALVAIFLIVAIHGERIKSDKKIKSRLTLWQDDLMIYTRLREVLINFMKARDTERINKKMQNELLPEIMKLRPEIINKLKNASEEMDMERLEENPEWEEILNKNGVGDKLKELTEIQLEGGDVMMMAFSNLKNFPFFNTVSNWFLPFSSNHSEVTTDTGDNLYFVQNY